jgi:hypothetical protein
MRARTDKGDRQAISAVVAATYSHLGRAGTVPAVNDIVVAAELSRWGRRGERAGAAAGLLAGATRRSWGRLILAAHLLDPASVNAGALVRQLVTTAWDAGGYHLLVNALQCAQDCARCLDPTDRTALAELLQGLETDNWVHSSLLIEALAACGGIEPIADLPAIHARIRDVLARRNELDAANEAASIISNQFEEVEVVGPYGEAIQELDAETRLRLLLLAAHGDSPMWGSWTLERLVEAAPTGDRELDAQLVGVFGRSADTAAFDGPMPQENIAVHLAGLCGWARLSDALPPAEPPLTSHEAAWRLVDRLVLHLERSRAAIDPTVCWAELIAEYPAAAVDALYGLYSVRSHGDRDDIHKRLVDRFPTEFRRLFEWGLAHREEITSPIRTHRPLTRDCYIIGILGRVGTAETAALVCSYLPDPDLGPAVVQALKQLDGSATAS